MNFSLVVLEESVEVLLFSSALSLSTLSSKSAHLRNMKEIYCANKVAKNDCSY